MTTSAHDPFSASFDSIEPTSASRSAIDHAFDLVTPTAAAPDLETPGFYLTDDAQGRFVIDREMGVISLKDEATLDAERMSIHAARMRVVERTGESYEMELKLRLTGRVPQMVGAEDALFDIPAPETAPTATAPQTHWTRYAAAQTMCGKGPLMQSGALVQPEYPAVSATYTHFAITEALPPAFAADDY